MSDFYVGWDPNPPARLMRFVRRVAMGLVALAVGLALFLILAQQPFAASFFDFGHEQTFAGVVETEPYPVLVVQVAGSRGEAATLATERYLLVAPGKRGADALVAGWEGRRAQVRGTLIERDGHKMLEVTASPTAADIAPAPAQEPAVSLGRMQLQGEVVDSKCYLGVMNPGQGKVHRDCAARCLSGGIPPALLTTLGGKSVVALLTDGSGHAPTGEDHQRTLRYAGEPVQVSGELFRQGDSLTLHADLRTLAPLPSGLGLH
jgi:hypothetical protein